MKPTERTDGRWQVRIPVKLSKSGKRESRYFPSKSRAAKFVAEFKTESREHGRSGVSGKEREWIAYARNELGNLDLLPEVIRHWKRTGERLSPILTAEAAKVYSKSAESEYENRRTLNDVKERVQVFSARFGARELHEIMPDEIEHFLAGFSAGWSRWSAHKRLKPFFKFAKRRRWITVDPMAEMPTPKTPAATREVYSPNQFQGLLWIAESKFPDLLPYVVLCGFCYMRTAELVRMYAKEQVLLWSDVHWKDGLIHVRPGVAKGTRRERGDERFVPLSDTAKEWLEPIRKTDGACVPFSAKKFGELWRKLTNTAKVPRIDNGLRHSAISYALAADPELGVVQVSRYAGNSEKTVKKHYLRLLKPEQGKKWFAVLKYSEVKDDLEGQLRAQQQPDYDPDAF
jgi:integrase